MNVLLTSTGLETDTIKTYFMDMVNKNMSTVQALFIPTAAINADAIGVLPKCINDLIKCGIPKQNITIYDLHFGMKQNELQQYDIIYLCGGEPQYLLERVNQTGFRQTLMDYIQSNGVVIGVSAGSIIFCNNLPNNLALLNTTLDVHCPEGEKNGKVSYPLKNNIRLTNTCALAVREFPNGLEIIGD